jgi:hypothetical protein
MFRMRSRVPLVIGVVTLMTLFMFPAVANASGGCVQNGKFTQCDYSITVTVGTCGKYSGTVWWDDDDFGTYAIGTDGHVSSGCANTTIYAHLAFNQESGIVSYNEDVGHANSDRVVAINFSMPLQAPGGVSSVHMYVCSTNGGWHCGSSKYV